MKIAFYKAKYGNWVDKLISLVTFSEYSHCEIVFSDGICGSASERDGGVRLKKINLDSGHWDVFEINNNIDEEIMRFYFDLMDSCEYDYIGAFLSIFYIGLIDEDKEFCSKICSMVVGGPYNLSPGALYRFMKKNNYIK